MKIIDLKKDEFLKLENQALSLDKDFKDSLNFLQSYQWSQIQKSNGNKVFLKSFNDNHFLVIEKKLFLSKKYYYIPKGPLFFNDFNEAEFLKSLQDLSLKNNISFVRLEPSSAKFNLNDKCFKKSKDIQPSKTIILNLNLSEEDLLNNMSAKTRYNIRLADKRGVRVLESDISSFEAFWKLMSLTAERDKFFIHPKSYYYNLIKQGSKFIRIFEARHGDKVLALGIFSFFGNTVSYLHGASSNEMRNLMAPQALQWELIKTAKQENFKYYDFCGIDEIKWPGVTRFKKGFSGQKISFPGTYDYVIDKQIYFAYKFLRRLRRILKFL